MQKATVTYVAPFGDAKEVTMGGVTFPDGKPVEINSYENPHLMSKFKGSNALFDVTVGKEDNAPPPSKAKRGRPSNAQIAEAKAAAEEADRVAKEAAEKAKAAKANSEAAVKAGAVKDEKPGMTAAEPKSDIKAGQSEATNHDFEKDRQNQTAKRDAQARGIGPAEDRPDNQRPVGQTAGQNQSNYGGQGQSGYVQGQTGAQGQSGGQNQLTPGGQGQAGYAGGHGQATTGGQNQQSGLTPGNPPGGQQPKPDHTT